MGPIARSAKARPPSPIGLQGERVRIGVPVQDLLECQQDLARRGPARSHGNAEQLVLVGPLLVMDPRDVETEVGVDQRVRIVWQILANVLARYAVTDERLR